MLAGPRRLSVRRQLSCFGPTGAPPPSAVPHNMRSIQALVSCLVLLVACGEPVAPVRPISTVIGAPSREISDATHGSGNRHLFFLPPLALPKPPNGAFDPNVPVEVDICELSGSSCVSPSLAHFTRAGSGTQSIQVNQSLELYSVMWKTDDAKVSDGKTYRIRILVQGNLLGFADVQIITSLRQAKSLLNSDTFPLVDGVTLPITFRLEQGIFAQRLIDPATGGTIASGTDVSLSVPPGALPASSTGSTSITIVALPVSSTPNAVPGTGYDLGPSGLAFAVPVKLSVSYDRAGLGSARENTLKLFTETSSGSWAPIFASTVDTRTHMVVGSTTHFSAYAAVPASTVSAGQNGNCAIGVSGATSCWGVAQFASGANGDNTPTAVPGGFAFTAVAASQYLWYTREFACGLTSGQVLCWGQGPLGSSASVTTTTVTGDSGTATVVDWPRVTTPTGIASPSGVGFKQVVVGSDFACALADDGTPYCWGDNFTGQLGMPIDGPGCVDAQIGTCTLAPVAIATPLKFDVLAAGATHACGLSAGVAYCWGDNGYGQQGTGGSERYNESPTRVQMPAGVTFATLTAGNAQTCALATDGAAYCWGEAYRSGAGTVPGPANYMNEPGFSSPTAVAGGLKFAALSAGGDFTCGVTEQAAGNAIYCWGWNTGYVLGSSQFDRSANPVKVDGTRQYQSISAGRWYACAVEVPPGNGVYCWGYDGTSQTGTPTLINVP